MDSLSEPLLADQDNVVALTSTSNQDDGNEDVENSGSNSQSSQGEAEVGHEYEGEPTTNEEVELTFPLSDIDTSWWSRLLSTAFWTPLLPQGPQHLRVQLRFLKLLGITLIGISITHIFVFSLNWEHRQGLTLYNTWLYEGNLILLDCLALFSVGRLYDKPEVDHLAWILAMLMSSLYTSFLPKISWLQHSVTLYELVCSWPWQLWVFVLVWMVPACTTAVVLHLQYARRQPGELTRKAVEVVLTLGFFLFPQMGHSSFEFHHWFAGLLFGMHANYNVWWSRLTMAWCWGQYVNGIAVWGRDPTLKCEYASYITKRQGCCHRLPYHQPFMDITTTTIITTIPRKEGHLPYVDYDFYPIEETALPRDACWIDTPTIHPLNGFNTPEIDPAPPPDWRHCAQRN